MDNNIIDGRVEALNNALNYYKLTGYTIHKYHQEDKRKVKQLYFLTDNKGTSLTGHWDYAELNSFIRGYGKACNECGKAARLLEDLTPGGSEFYNDPQYCFDFIKKELQSIPSQVLPFKQRADKLKVINDSLLEALKEFLKVINRSDAALYHYDKAIKLGETAIKQSEQSKNAAL